MMFIPVPGVWSKFSFRGNVIYLSFFRQVKDC